jgi:hypothetical protein
MSPGPHTIDETPQRTIQTPDDLSEPEGIRFQEILNDLAACGLPVNVRAAESTRLYLIQDRINRHAADQWETSGSFPTITGASGIPVKNPLVLEMSRALDAMTAILDQLYRSPAGGPVRAPLDDDDDLDLD